MNRITTIISSLTAALTSRTKLVDVGRASKTVFRTPFQAIDTGPSGWGKIVKGGEGGWRKAPAKPASPPSTEPAPKPKTPTP